jgi:general secretion pathway protein A
MYNEHFGFRESPFTTTPNSRLFYSNDLYQEALANLRYGIEWKKGLIVMTGEVGTGKTTLLTRTMRGLGAAVHPIFVSYDHLTSVELLRIIAQGMGLKYDAHDRLATIEQLREQLIVKHKKAEIIALLIDEAQNLSDEMFEDIRFLSNIETEREKLLQIVLTGQPELEVRLDQLHLRHIKQRIVVHCRLAALKSDEVGRYIDVRLREAGYQGEVLFGPDAIGRIALYSEGIPRLINIICDNALLIAYAQSKSRVTADMIQEVVRDLRLIKPCPAQAGSGPTITASPAARPAPAKPPLCLPSDTQPAIRRKVGFALIPTGVSLALVAIGSAGSAIYSWPITTYFHQASAPEHRARITKDPTNKLGESTAPMRSAGGARANGEGVKQPRTKVEAKPASDAKKTKAESRAEAENESLLGKFQVTGSNSFVRGSARADGKIIATLSPGTQVEVVGTKGNYLRVHATADGERIRGYVHRQDAFFEPAGNDVPRKPRRN